MKDFASFIFINYLRVSLFLLFLVLFPVLFSLLFLPFFLILNQLLLLIFPVSPPLLPALKALDFIFYLRKVESNYLCMKASGTIEIVVTMTFQRVLAHVLAKLQYPHSPNLEEFR